MKTKNGPKGTKAQSKGTKATARKVAVNDTAETVNAEGLIVNAEPIDEDGAAELVNAAGDQVEDEPATDQVQDLQGAPVDEAVVDETQDQAAPAASAPAAATPPRARDPRLPEPGMPIEKVWKHGGQTHQVQAFEQTDGAFAVYLDGNHIGVGKSLTRAAELALEAHGVTGGVNGFRWFGLVAAGTAPTKTPRAGKALVTLLAAGIAKLEAKRAKVVAQLAALDEQLAIARQALEDAQAPGQVDVQVDEVVAAAE